MDPRARTKQGGLHLRYRLFIGFDVNLRGRTSISNSLRLAHDDAPLGLRLSTLDSRMVRICHERPRRVHSYKCQGARILEATWHRESTTSRQKRQARALPLRAVQVLAGLGRDHRPCRVQLWAVLRLQLPPAVLRRGAGHEPWVIVFPARTPGV